MRRPGAHFPAGRDMAIRQDTADIPAGLSLVFLFGSRLVNQS